MPGGPSGLQPPPPVNPDISFASFQESSRIISEFVHDRTLTIDDLRVLCYGAGRAMLWIVVVVALWSMYDYFVKFYGKVRDKIEVRERRKMRLLRKRKRRAERLSARIEERENG